MEQKLMGETLPAETACGDAVIDMGPNESVLILIKHCQEMKQQETRLRLITLLLLLGCTAMFIFAIFAICLYLRQHNISGSSGQESSTEQSSAYSKQERVCPTDSSKLQRLHIHLRSNFMSESKSDEAYIKWDVLFGEYNQYDEEKRAIVIPETGVYFVYMRFALVCQGDKATNFERFQVELHTRSEGYDKTVTQMDAGDVIACPSKGSRSVFVGELMDLLKGDLVSVWIGEGYNLITESFFGAYLT